MDVLKKKRNAIKGIISRIESFIIAQIHASNTFIDVEQIRVRSQKLDSYFTDFEEIQAEIEALDEVDDEYRKEMEEWYYDLKAKCAKVLNTERVSVSLDNTTLNSSPDMAAKAELENSTSTNNKSIAEHDSSAPTNDKTITPIYEDLKLPRTSIPAFSGSFTDWPSFYDLYSALVHKNTKLSFCQKLQFLKSAVTGEAASTIKHLANTDGNYSVAWELPVSKYNKEKFIMEAHLKIICDQPSLSQTLSASMLRKVSCAMRESVNALKALQLSTDAWDCWLVYVIVQKLDMDTKQLWARKTAAITRPSFDQLMDLLDERKFELQTIQQAKKHGTPRMSTITAGTSNNIRQVFTVECLKCRSTHNLSKCPRFLALSAPDRESFVSRNQLCVNCFRSGHGLNECKSSFCRLCHKRHHTLLHDSFERTSSALLCEVSNPLTILPTAIVFVKESQRQMQCCRALLDSGSQSTLITEACVQRLNLRRSNSNTIISGIGSSGCIKSRGQTHLKLRSLYKLDSIDVIAVILPKLSGMLPNTSVRHIQLDEFKSVNLADNEFYKPSPIDIILGCDVLFNIMLPEQIQHSSGLRPQNTIFGYVVAGSTSLFDKLSSSFQVQIDMGSCLRRFWELDGITDNTPKLTHEEMLAEQHFVDTHQRQPDGRLRSMERKFQGDANLHSYSNFMREYEELGHMGLVSDDDSETTNYYIPHHAVHKEFSTSTKLRVVFNASKCTSTGVSLNDNLLVGYVIQDDMTSILLRFRMHPVTFTGDITKMYRQVNVSNEDAKFQRVLWREEASDPYSTYELTTVTYGTGPAQFLATRTLKQLVADEGNRFPRGASILEEDFYVDDVMSGAETLEEAKLCVRELTAILKAGGFNICKWSSNCKDLIEMTPEHMRETQSSLNIDESKFVKTLGLYWNVDGDYFFFKVSLDQHDRITKRQILSDMSRIIDPLGLLAPAIVTINILIQKLWIMGVEWDEELYRDIRSEWEEICSELEFLGNIRIPRYIPTHPASELHVFSDASERAYGAVLYARTSSNGTWITRLVASKTKVAPIKQISIPKLELSAAHLAVKLLSKIKTALKMPTIPSYGWTDSTIVLAWLSDYPRRWETFIANRTSEILEVLPRANWRHVPSSKNPADMASRGVSASQLAESSLWWIIQERQFPTTTIGLRKSVFLATTPDLHDHPILYRYSSLQVMKRIAAYCLRFFHNLKNKPGRRTGYLTTEEMRCAFSALIRAYQRSTFVQEVNLVINGKQLPPNNRLSSLRPFVDSNGIMRVGGRLHNAQIEDTRSIQ